MGKLEVDTKLIQTLIRCVVCWEFFSKSEYLWTCVYNHTNATLCCSCYLRLRLCPICRAPIQADTRNHTMERLMDTVNFQKNVYCKHKRCHYK